MKKFLKVILAFAAVTGFCTVSAAANPLDYNNNIGLYYMMNTTGTYLGGLQYQHWFTDKIGATFEGSGYYNSGTSLLNSNYLFWANVNAEFDYKLYESSISSKTATKLYAWGKAGYFARIVGVDSSSEGGSSGTVIKYAYKPSVVAGAGFCLEMTAFEHISIPVQFGFLGQMPYNPGFGFTFGSGVRYTF